MDIETLRTFLEVSRTRHFAKAAETLFVTQGAVSARIRQLEMRLGMPVFDRARNNIQLTTAGHRLFPHAEIIVGSWNRAIAEVNGPEDASLVSIGCVPSIGEIFLDDMLSVFREQSPDTLIQVEQLNSPSLVARVREQSLNLGLLYEPPRAKDLSAKHVADIDLIMVSTQPDADPANVTDYIYVDWGTSFALDHESNFSVSPRPIMRVDTPVPAYRLILSRGGAAYLPRRLVAADLARGRLHPVRSAPVVTRPVYLIRCKSGPESKETSAAVDIICTLTR